MRTRCFICNCGMTGRGKGGDLHRKNGSAHVDCLWRASRDYMRIKNVVTGKPANWGIDGQDNGR